MMKCCHWESSITIVLHPSLCLSESTVQMTSVYVVLVKRNDIVEPVHVGTCRSKEACYTQSWIKLVPILVRSGFRITCYVFSSRYQSLQHDIRPIGVCMVYSSLCEVSIEVWQSSVKVSLWLSSISLIYSWLYVCFSQVIKLLKNIFMISVPILRTRCSWYIFVWK